MDLTVERMKYINSLTYEQLLSKWRFAPLGDKWFQGETGNYWGKRMTELRDEETHVLTSKKIGWEQ